MARLTTLRPRVSALPLRLFKAAAVERLRGRAWMQKRERIAQLERENKDLQSVIDEEYG